MHLLNNFYNNFYNNLGILSTIKFDISCIYNINNLYFDMDISLYYNFLLLLFAYFMLLSLILTIVYFFIRDKRLVNFSESQVELYDSGNNIGCDSSSDEGNYTSGNSDSDDDDEDEEIKLTRRKRRWLNNRNYVSKYSPHPQHASRIGNTNYNTYIECVRDIYIRGEDCAIPRGGVLDKKKYKDIVRGLNRAKLDNPHLNFDLEKLSKLHAYRYHKLLYKDYNYKYLTPEIARIVAEDYNILVLYRWRDLVCSMTPEELRIYLLISENAHANYLERAFNHTAKWDGWYVRQVAKWAIKVLWP